MYETSSYIISDAHYYFLTSQLIPDVVILTLYVGWVKKMISVIEFYCDYTLPVKNEQL